MCTLCIRHILCGNEQKFKWLFGLFITCAQSIEYDCGAFYGVQTSLFHEAICPAFEADGEKECWLCTGRDNEEVEFKRSHKTKAVQQPH